MDVRGSLVRYGGQCDPPQLSREADALYRAITTGAPWHGHLGQPHYAAQDVAVIAERLECDAQVARLAGRIECRAGYGDIRGPELHIVVACVTVYPRSSGTIHSLSAAAACRLANRLDSGLDQDEAVARTVADCEHHPYTERQVEALEKHADSHLRRLDRLDAEYADDLGGLPHRLAIAALRD